MKKLFALIVTAAFASTAAAQVPMPQVMPGGPVVQPSIGTVITGNPAMPGVVYGGVPTTGTTFPSTVIQGAPFGTATGPVYSQPYTTGLTYPTMGTTYTRPYTSFGNTSYAPVYSSNGVVYGSGYPTPYSTSGYTGTPGFSSGFGTGVYNTVVGTPVRVGRSVFNRVGGVFRR